MTQQFDFAFVADTFNLSGESGEDTDRTARELTEAERAKAEADKRQVALNLEGQP